MKLHLTALSLAALLSCTSETPADEPPPPGTIAPTTPRFASRADATAAGLLAYFRFDDTDGATLLDSAGTFAGVVLGGDSTTEGRVGGGWFRGAYFAQGFHLNLAPTSLTTFSAAFWWKPTDMSIYSPNDGAGLVWFNQTALWTHMIAMNGNPTPNRLVLWNATTGTAVDGGANLVQDTWHHLAITVDTTEATLYLNGAKVAAMPSATHQFQLEQRINLLNYSSMPAGSPDGNPNAHYGRGVIDDFSIWNRKLTADDVARLHTHGLAGLPVF